MNRLMILGNDLEFSRKLFNYIISWNKKVQLCNLAITTEEIADQIEWLRREDILILDLEGDNINGIEILEMIEQKCQQIPYIIILSESIDSMIELKGYVTYIHKVVIKPFSFTRMLDIIDKITYKTDRKKYEKLVKQELKKFDINVTTLGYTYIVEAIILTLQDETLLASMQNLLYKEMSLNNNVSAINIKWAVEKCIKSVARFTSNDIIRSYFKIEAGEKITPKFFILTVTENIKMKINETKQKVYY